MAAYVGYAADRTGQDAGALASAGLAQAKTGEQIFTAAGCAGCHTLRPGQCHRHDRPEPERAEDPGGDIEKGKTADEYIRESIEDPGAFIVKGLPERDAARSRAG